MLLGGLSNLYVDIREIRRSRERECSLFRLRPFSLARHRVRRVRTVSRFGHALKAGATRNDSRTTVGLRGDRPSRGHAVFLLKLCFAGKSVKSGRVDQKTSSAVPIRLSILDPGRTRRRVMRPVRFLNGNFF